MTAKEYLFDLAPDCRLRHRHVRIKNKVVDFSVQVEGKIKDRWAPGGRYDTAPGFAHRDHMHADGRTEKAPIFARDYGYNEALTFAEADLKANWELYKNRFLEEVSEL